MDLVTPSIGLVFWTTISFLLLLFLLTKYAWKPVLKMIKDRESSIEEAIKSAENARKDIADMRKYNENQLAEVRKERDAILKEAREIKENIITEAKQQAKTEAQKIMAAERESFINEKNAAVAEIKTQVAVLSLEIAEKILKTELSNDDKQKALVTNLLNEVKLN
ncbi:MAG: F0F1 ATP synthase subunit B [Bacteroidota bacterium]